MRDRHLLDNTRKLFELSLYGAFLISTWNLWPMINLIAIERFLKTAKFNKKQKLAIINFIENQRRLRSFKESLDNFHSLSSKKGRKEIVKLFTKRRVNKK